MNDWFSTVKTASCGAAAYLIGAIPFGYLVGRINGIDVRKLGSGNIGATNVFRTVGKGWGVITFVADMLKGLVSVTILPQLVAPDQDGLIFLKLAYGCLAVAGHNWPVFLRFRGGKGVATGAGALVGLAPGAAGVGLAAWVLVFMASGYVSLASITAALAAPVGAWFATRDVSLAAVLGVLAAVVIWRHRSNINRLVQGTEHRPKFKRRAPEDAQE